MPDIIDPKELEQKKIFLILASPGTIRQRNIDVIREVSTLGYHTVVITTNFPYRGFRKTPIVLYLSTDYEKVWKVSLI